MKNDLISRAALFNSLANVKTLEEAFAAIQNAPSAEYWIPCAERLPEGNGKSHVFGLEYSDVVLVSGGFYDGDQIHGTGAYLYNHKTPELSGWVGAYCDGSDLELSDVMAWMPLPEPYKEDE